MGQIPCITVHRARTFWGNQATDSYSECGDGRVSISEFLGECQKKEIDMRFVFIKKW